MIKNYWINLLAILFFASGCTGIQRIQDNSLETTENLKTATAIIAKRVEDADQKITAISNATTEVVAKVSEVKVSLEDKVKEIRESLSQDRAKIEEITGPFDNNGDGKVSFDEIKTIVKDNKSQWSDIDFWISIVLAYLGITTGGSVLKSGAKSVAAKMHSVGRRELAKRGGSNSTGNTS